MVIPAPVDLPPSKTADVLPDAWRVPGNVVAKPVTLTEAEAIVDRLDRFIQTSAAHYGADPGECADAAVALADLRAWLAELAGRNRRVQL
jgi:hypothetical protein